MFKLKQVLILTTTILFAGHLFSQEIKTNIVVKKEVSKLAFLVGQWNGTGWMMNQDQQKHNFTQTENIQFKLDSTAILVEGEGKSNNVIIHNAMAIISFNVDSNNYSFHSYLQNRKGGQFKGELVGKKFIWFPSSDSRFVIEINKKGQWVEVGEFKQNGEWQKFFEMTLDKQE